MVDGPVKVQGSFETTGYYKIFNLPFAYEDRLATEANQEKI